MPTSEIIAADRDGAASFAANWSLETIPAGSALIDPAIHRLRGGTCIYIASIPGRDIRNVVDAAIELRAANFEPVPHVTARSLKDRAELDDLLARLRGEADVRSALLLGGDIDGPMVGPFASSRAMLATGLFARRGFTKVGFATYPEQHPLIQKPVLENALVDKLGLAAEQGLESWLVTQLCFDPDVIVRHAEHLRALRVGAPIHVGTAGPTSWKGLARFAMICGVAATARSVTTQGAWAGRLLAGFEPSQIVNRVAAAAAARPGLGLVGPHFFTFGGVEKTVKWLCSFSLMLSKLSRHRCAE
jgi:methylenetetrahydrofolate reductase (NADPH)